MEPGTDSSKKYSIRSSKELFPKTEDIQMTILFSEPKKESRLISKKLSKQESKNSENRNSKVEEEKKSNRNS